MQINLVLADLEVGDHIVTGFRQEPILITALTASQLVVTFTAHETVVAMATKNSVIPIATIDDVISGSAVYKVIVKTTPELIMT